MLKELVGKTVLVRTYSAGVHFGILDKYETAGSEYSVKLTDAIRVYSWAGANSLSQLAAEGTKNTSTELSVKVPSIYLKAIEVIEMTDLSVERLNKSLPGDMIDLSTYLIEDVDRYEKAFRYLKTEYQSNKLRFEKRFLEPLSTYLQMYDVENWKDIIKLYSDGWDMVEPYNYEQAFKIADEGFRAKVFSVIDVPEMIRNLGSERIETNGIELNNKTYNMVTGEFENIEMTQVYELHKVNGEKLGVNDNIYAIKCWCTSTDQEHWIWTDKRPDGKDTALSAIAATCMVYKPMLGKIKHIIRQGDVFIFEMTEKVAINEDKDEVVPLDKETYFKLLKSQS